MSIYLSILFRLFAFTHNLCRWIFAQAAAPTFLISSLHICVRRVQQDTRYATMTNTSLWALSRAFITICLAVDFLALVLTIIGAAYVGAKSLESLASSQPGFEIMTAAMAVQLCSLLATLVVAFEFTVSLLKLNHGISSGSCSSKRAVTDAPDKQIPVEKNSSRYRVFLALLLSE